MTEKPSIILAAAVTAQAKAEVFVKPWHVAACWAVQRTSAVLAHAARRDKKKPKRLAWV
jgi:hypothetical protein